MKVTRRIRHLNKKKCSRNIEISDRPIDRELAVSYQGQIPAVSEPLWEQLTRQIDSNIGKIAI